MSTLAAKMGRNLTADDLLAMPDEGRGYELIDGRLEINPMSARSCWIGGFLHRAIGNYCEGNRGWAFPQDTGFRCFAGAPNRVRKPDTAFIVPERYTNEQFASEGFIGTVPDLVIEVISPKDKSSKVETKIGQWLAAGVNVVWVVHPEERLVREHRPDGSVRQYRDADVLVEPTLLPGFACPVADLFKLPGATSASSR